VFTAILLLDHYLQHLVFQAMAKKRVRTDV